jgi:lipoyl(octanoyl) transferase
MQGMSQREWRALDTAPAPGAWNMAVDDTLMASVRAGGAPALRFFRWSPACLSLGRNQPARGHYDAGRLAALGIEVVRRPTGGRAVLHDAELTYSAVAPVALFGGARAAYLTINQALVEGLRSLGAAATIQGPSASRAPYPSTEPCFAQPVDGEVLGGGRKLIGSAQLCADGVLLQHGSLPLRRPGFARRAPEHACPPSGSPAYLEDLLDPLPAWECLTRSLAAAWSRLVGPLRPDGLSEAEQLRAAASQDHYRSEGWTWRR